MTLDIATPDQDPLHALRARVLADEPVQHELAALRSRDAFVERVMAFAAAQGIALPVETLTSALVEDPLGLSRWTVSPVSGTAWPGPAWLPIAVQILDGSVFIDWGRFGGTRLIRPFFEESIREVLNTPFNRMFRYRMSFADFMASAGRQVIRGPAGFIFHMSRSGSTLVAQMLAAVSSNVVLSEAAPIDTMAQLCRLSPDLPVSQAADFIRAIVLAFARPREGAQGPFFVKLDSWHILLQPLFRQAFPGVPWVFLYREPVEVLVSQMRDRGPQLVPEMVSPALYGIDWRSEESPEIYCAQALAKICDAAAQHHGEDGGLLVNYQDLPDAVFTAILPHFGIAIDAAGYASMTAASRVDSKKVRVTFSADGKGKHDQATPAIRDAAARHLDDVYRRLEALRGSAPGLHRPR